MTAAIEYRTQDKSTWGDGPWQKEPDKVQFVDEATGLDCLIVRNRLGALCGYVGVPEGHPFHGVGYGQCADKSCVKEPTDWGAMPEDSKLKELGPQMDEMSKKIGTYDYTHCGHSPESRLEVHGGITFSDGCQEATRESFEKWRASMLESRASIRQYPKGDAAQHWKEDGHLIDDYEGWVQKRRAESICHIPMSGRPDNVWWFGFDCAHSMDLVPGMEARLREVGGGSGMAMPGYRDIYRTREYVEEQIRDLAKQLAEVGGIKLKRVTGRRVAVEGEAL